MKQLFSLLLLCAASAVFSQITYQPGYFINNSGVKTECLIKDVDWTNNPKNFEWKLNAEEVSQVKTVNDVTEFGVSGNKYKKFNVNVDRSGIILTELSTVKEPRWVNETLFLKVIVEGEPTLYGYKDGNFERFFVSSVSHTTAEQLVYKEYKNGNYVQQNAYFRQQLYTLMKAKMPDATKFKNIDYKRKPLVKLFSTYTGNEPLTEQIQKTAKVVSKGSFNLKVIVGANLATLNVANNHQQNYQYFENLNNKFSSETALSVGAEAEYILPFYHNKVSVFSNPNIQFYKSSAGYTKPLGTSVATYNWKANYTFAEIPVGLRYHFYVSKKSKLFIDAAYVMALNVGSSSIDYNFSNNLNNSAFDAGMDIAKNSSCFAFGAGFAYEKYSAAFRFTTKRNIVDYPIWDANYSSIGLILGYKIL